MTGLISYETILRARFIVKAAEFSSVKIADLGHIQ